MMMLIIPIKQLIHIKSSNFNVKIIDPFQDI